MLCSPYDYFGTLRFRSTLSKGAPNPLKVWGSSAAYALLQGENEVVGSLQVIPFGFWSYGLTIGWLNHKGVGIILPTWVLSQSIPKMDVTNETNWKLQNVQR